MDRISAMQTFVRVVETGSFSAVAREQKSTQSAVSKQVAALEKHLGVKLLNRTTRAVAISDDGARYCAEARRLLAEIVEAESQLRQGQHQLTGWLHVAAPVGYTLRVLMPHIQSFMSLHPGLKVDLKLSDGFIDLIAQGIDVAVRTGHLSDSSLVARRISDVEGVLVASTGFQTANFAQKGTLKNPQELKRYACILYGESNKRNDWNFTHSDGRQESVCVDGPLQTNHWEVVRTAVLGGFGFAYAPTWLFKDLLDSGAVAAALPDWKARTLPVHLVSPASRRQAMKVKAFGDHIALALAS